MSERLTFSVQEFAETIGVGGQTVYDAIARGEIRHVRIGRRIVIPRDVLTDLGIAQAAASCSGPPEAVLADSPMPRPRDSQTIGSVR
jgi:excisionase family DNA binding protein